jgi:phage baseplate assembly protein W|tara:strand:- start:1691 stop:2098 length:408 start_codon:yes stop_codon:yes gene_type:complete
MARIIASKNPIDLQPSRAVGFGFPLDGDAVFIPTYTTRAQTKANMLNYLLTNRGERVFRPNFGSNLRSLLFENIVDAELQDLQSIIQEDIGRFFPNVTVKEIEFNNDPDRNEINFTLIYEIINLGVEDNLEIVIQ